MRSVEIFLCALFASALTASCAEFETANRLYDEGKFLEAKQLYEKLVADGQWSANLFYNLANADFRLGAPGVAALNYERTLALDAHHPEAAMNLRLLRDQTGARVTPSSWRDHLFASIPSNLFDMVGAAAAWLAIFSLTAIILRRSTASPNLWLVFILALVLAAYCGAGIWHRAADASLAIVTARQAEARLAPADRAARAETLPAGSRVRAISERGEWIYCALPGGGLGWLPAGTVEKVRLKRS
jgi:hypothetical protein